MRPAMDSASVFYAVLGVAALCAALLHCGLHAMSPRGREHFWLAVAALGVVQLAVGYAMAYAAQSVEEAHYAQTLGLLIFAYVLLFLPVAVGALRTSLLQVSPRLEEAARSLGSRPRRVLVAITFPLIRPGIRAGGALVFLVTMKELPATLVLGPIGFKTLATSTWSFASEAFFAQAAVASLLLVVASAAILALLVLPERRRS